MASVTKSTFRFSCLTGHRKSDIEKHTWGEIQKFGEFTRIVFKQKNTGGQEYLDISPQAEKLLGTRRNDADRVFEGSDDMPAHAKSTLCGVRISIPITKGRLNLGTLPGIHSCAIQCGVSVE